MDPHINWPHAIECNRCRAFFNRQKKILRRLPGVAVGRQYPLALAQWAESKRMDQPIRKPTLTLDEQKRIPRLIGQEKQLAGLDEKPTRIDAIQRDTTHRQRLACGSNQTQIRREEGAEFSATHFHTLATIDLHIQKPIGGRSQLGEDARRTRKVWNGCRFLREKRAKRESAVDQRTLKADIPRERTAFFIAHRSKFTGGQQGERGMTGQWNAVRAPAQAPLRFPGLLKLTTPVHREAPRPDHPFDVFKKKGSIDHCHFSMQTLNPCREPIKTETGGTHLRLAGDFKRVGRVADLGEPRNFTGKIVQKRKNRARQSQIKPRHFDIGLKGSVRVEPPQRPILGLRKPERKGSLQDQRRHAGGLHFSREACRAAAGFEIHLNSGCRNISSTESHIATLDERIEIRLRRRPGGLQLHFHETAQRPVLPGQAQKIPQVDFTRGIGPEIHVPALHNRRLPVRTAQNG